MSLFLDSNLSEALALGQVLELDNFTVPAERILFQIDQFRRSVYQRQAQIMQSSHQVIRALATQFAAEKLAKNPLTGEQCLAPTAPTIQELARIQRGFYNIWIFSILFKARKESLGYRNDFRVPDSDQEAFLRTISFWDYMIMQRLLKYLEGKLRPIVEKFGEDNRDNPEFEERRPVGDFTYNEGYLGTILSRWGMPRIHAFLNAEPDKQTSLLHDDLLHHEHSGAVFYHETFNFIFSVYDPVELSPGELDDQRKRICKVKDAVIIRTDDAYYEWPLADGVDLDVCMWDDERLEDWGYFFPKDGVHEPEYNYGVR